MKKTTQRLMDDIRDLGFKARIRHVRLVQRTGEKYPDYMDLSAIRESEWHEYILARGGTTQALIYRLGDTKDAIPTAVFEAECSLKENYVKKIGAMIALGRALKSLSA